MIILKHIYKNQKANKQRYLNITAWPFLENNPLKPVLYPLNRNTTLYLLNRKTIILRSPTIILCG